MQGPPSSIDLVDRLSAVFERFRVRAHLFHSGPLCGVTRFAEQPGLGFLHVLRRGEMAVTHPRGKGAPRRLAVTEPSLLFYPRPLEHSFHNAPSEGSDFVCATLRFDGGVDHPLARALPPLVVLPLSRIQSMQHTLALLFAETEQVRCGQRLLADRLFEVLLLQLLRWLLDHPDGTELPVGLLCGLSHPGLARALAAVHERPADTWSVESMARQAGMSRSAFAVAFRQAVGQTPADYLLGWRVALAQSRLLEGAALKTLAVDLGYGSASALSRAFTQHLGQSPRAWLAAARR
jgi:AraC-like DNA-binding protein